MQLFSLLIDYASKDLENEKNILTERVNNLRSYSQSFDVEDDSHYTLLFADAFLNGLGVFFSVFEIERALRIFEGDSSLFYFCFLFGINVTLNVK